MRRRGIALCAASPKYVPYSVFWRGLQLHTINSARGQFAQAKSASPTVPPPVALVNSAEFTFQESCGGPVA